MNSAIVNETISPETTTPEIASNKTTESYETCSKFKADFYLIVSIMYTLNVIKIYSDIYFINVCLITRMWCCQ